MKPILTTIAILMSFSISWAASPEFDSYMCITDFPTSSFFLNIEDDMAKMTIMHHNGMTYAPVFKGLITSNDVEHIKKSASFAKKMGETLKASFKLDECSRLKNHDISCFHNSKTMIGDLEVENYYLLIYESVTKNTFGEFKEKHAKFQYRIKGRTYEIPMDYASHECGPL